MEQSHMSDDLLADNAHSNPSVVDGIMNIFLSYQVLKSSTLATPAFSTHHHLYAIQLKIHQTYCLQYLKDVVLTHILDYLTFNMLSSFIIVNLIDIINHIMQDATFLSDLLKPLFLSPDTTNAHILIQLSLRYVCDAFQKVIMMILDLLQHGR